MNEDALRASLPFDRLQRVCLWVAGVLGVVGGVAAVLDVRQFFQAYLCGFLFWWMASMGCLGWSLLHELTGGRWGYAARPFLYAGIRTLPLIVLAFVPLAIGLKFIYAWTGAEFFTGDPHAESRRWYLSETFFLGRAAGYFAVGALFGLPLTRRAAWFADQSQLVTRPLWGGLGAVALALVISFAAIDWGMSLEPEWYSTIYGAIFVGGGLLTAAGIIVASLGTVMHRVERSDEASRTVLHDWGKLLLAVVAVWAYLHFSQFLIMYAGNLPVETVWYQRRLAGGWQAAAVALVVLHFAVPLACLLSRELKRDPRKLAAVAVGLVAVRVLDVLWMIVPAFDRRGFALPWLDATLVIGLGGLWMFEYLRQLRKRFEPVPPQWPVAAAAGH